MAKASAYLTLHFTFQTIGKDTFNALSLLIHFAFVDSASIRCFSSKLSKYSSRKSVSDSIFALRRNCVSDTSSKQFCALLNLGNFTVMTNSFFFFLIFCTYSGIIISAMVLSSRFSCFSLSIF